MGWVRRGAAAVTSALALAIVAGCAGEPMALPTIGSPVPTPTATLVEEDRSQELERRWDLRGADLPDDWPDVPLPEGTEVITAYAIGNEPRRTWTATFAADGGTALALAEPVVEELRAREYAPIAEYVGAAETNTGLYSFAAPTFAVYIVLGEENERPNLVITVRGSTSATAGLPSGRPSPAASTGATATSSSSAAPDPVRTSTSES